MSGFQAPAAVTAALRQRLLDVVLHDVPTATVTSLRPADPGVGGIPSIGVNLFLFAAHISATQRNLDLPGRRSGGGLVQRPVVPLDLDYLVSFYGDENGVAHQLLGVVMRSLYVRPVLTPAMIAAVETPASGLHSRLADQAERVRLTPLPLPLEEMSKLWSVFFQTSYALSVAFRAGPVLVEAELDTAGAPPVTESAGIAVAPRVPAPA